MMQQKCFQLCCRTLCAIAPKQSSVMLAFCVFTQFLASCSLYAAPLTAGTSFTQRLASAHSGFVDGKSLRLAILDVATISGKDSEHVNVWLDRKVDPGLPVSPGALGPTRYASLIAIANEADCICYPVDDCVVIGRPQWVAEVAQNFFSNPSPETRVAASSARFDFSWPRLSTPAEVASHIAATSGFGASASSGLPHDLWPDHQWKEMRGATAIKLVRMQFADVTERNSLSASFTRAYTSKVTEDLQLKVQTIDPKAEFRRSRTGPQKAAYQLTASVSAHVLLCNELWGVSENPQAESFREGEDGLAFLDEDQRTFTLNVQNKRAGDVLASLLGRVNLRCDFEQGANLLAQNIVSFSAKDQTLGQLVRLVAKQASMKAEASDKGVRFVPAE